MALPSGTVTFLFTDIEGSTKLAQEYPDAMPFMLGRHHEILNQFIQAHNGYAFQIVGDSFAVAFHNARDALNAALHIQRSLQNESWSTAPIKVRMGIHTGTARLNDAPAPTVYTGYATIALTQRIMSAGHGGQILLSSATRELVRDALPSDSELLDLGEKRLKDLLRPERLYQLNTPGLLATFPPLKTLDSFRNNLPIQLTTFIGREKEIAEVKQELEARRLVTLTGPGGAGKTRLSLQVAADLLDKFAHGVWFVELAPLTDPELISQTIISAIGLSEQVGKSPLELLKEYLHEKKSLIVLDNCEHLIEASAKVANTLLNAAPALKILASSREALGVQGELSYPVPSLSLPDPKKIPQSDQLTQYEAVHLFLDRASLANPHFLMTKENAPAIVQICQRLDGIPLALELAAARVRGLSIEQIASRLDDRFHLLTSGARTVLPRHQTLQALIDWSHDLLIESERMLLRRLTVFSGGWTLEAAESVCMSDGLESHQILDTLLHLVDKSLVIAETQEVETRYRMLETIRQYAREKLWAAGEGEIMRQRHLAYFVDLAERAEPNLRSFDMIVWLDRLESNLDNLRAALDWAQESDVEAQLRLASALLWLWHIRGLRKEGVDWLERGLSIEVMERGDRPRSPGRALIRGKALNVSGYLMLQSLIGKAAERFEESLGLLKELGLASRQGMAYALLGLSTENEAMARNEMLKQSLSLFREVGDKFGTAECLMFLAREARLEGDLEKEGAIDEEHLALRREIGDQDGIAIAHLHSGNTAFRKGDHPRATKLYEASLAGFREVGNKWGIGLALSELSAVAQEQGDHSQADRMLQEVLALAEDLGEKSFIATTLDYLGNAEWLMGDFDLAIKRFEGELIISRETGNKSLTSSALLGLARVAQSQGDYATARSFYKEAIVLGQQNRFPWLIAFCLSGLATLAALRFESLREAAQLFGMAETLVPSLQLEMPVVKRVEYDQVIAAVRAALGEEAFAMAWEEGKKMTMQQAIDFALGESNE